MGEIKQQNELIDYIRKLEFVNWVGKGKHPAQRKNFNNKLPDLFGQTNLGQIFWFEVKPPGVKQYGKRAETLAEQKKFLRDRERGLAITAVIETTEDIDIAFRKNGYPEK